MATDRISISFSSLLNSALFQKLDLFEIVRTPSSPIIDANSQNMTICSGNTASLIAYSDPNTLQLYWYAVPNGGTPIAILNSGETFTTPILTATTSYYVAAKNPNCEEESPRVEVVVNVNQPPTASDIDVTGNENAICAVDTVILTPSSAITGTYNWYFDGNGTNEITNGQVVGNITYAIDSNGVLTINGLTLNDSPVTYYLSITDSNTTCSNTPGDLKEVTITITNEATPTTTSTTQEFCSSQNATISDLQVNESPINWYATETGGTPLDPNTLLTTNTSYYAAIVGTTCESSIRLEVTVIINSDSQATLNGEFTNVCFSNEYTYTTESNMNNYQWSVIGGTISAGGDSTSNYVTINWDQSTTGNINVSYLDPTLCNGMASFSQDITINTCSDITISKVANVSQAAIGETVVFTITVNNNGSSNINNIEVSESLPSGYTYVSNTTSIGNYNLSTGIWSISSLLANESAVLEITVTVNATGNYINTALILDSDPIDSDLDNNTSTVEVNVSCLIVYNEFSPNNDGQNEYFIIDCIENYPNNRLEVFNRYGNIVYETVAYNNTWNGVANVSGVVNRGEILPVGTYYYSLKIDELNMTRSGWLYIAK